MFSKQIFFKRIFIFMSLLNLIESKKMSVKYLIDEISTNITIFDEEILQLRINWTDTIKGDQYYNVFLTPINNFSECSGMPCGIYGIRKPGDGIVLPTNPSTYIEHAECLILPGCNYTIKVETSNAEYVKTKDIYIPYCIEGICSCRHASELPKINAFAEILSNNSISVRWQLLLNKIDQMTLNLNLDKIYISISEQKNPLLRWGGPSKLLFERDQSISMNSETISSGKLNGEMLLNLSESFSPEFAYLLRAYVIDEMHCTGPETHLKMRVPITDSQRSSEQNSNFNVRTGMMIVPLLLLSVIFTIFTIFLYIRNYRLKASQVHQDKLLFPLVVDARPVNGSNEIEEQTELPDLFEIPHEAISLGPEIGEGAFGRVYKAIATNLFTLPGVSKRTVAVKQLKEHSTADEIEEFLKEIAMLKSVGMHANIVSFLGCCTIRQPYMMVMEFIGRGDLLDYLRKSRYTLAKGKARCAVTVDEQSFANKTNIADGDQVKYTQLLVPDGHDCLRSSVSETVYTELSCSGYWARDDQAITIFEYLVDNNELHNFALQIVNGMKFLEERQITHRDLAARNVLIDERKNLKISDFGLSRHGIYTNTKTRKLPLRWLSIEAILDNLYSNKSDVWAFGIVLWEIGTLGASPYPTISNCELIPFLLDGKRLEKPEICTEKVYELMSQCWNEDPQDRPTFGEIYNKLKPETAYVNLNSLSDDYVFPPIHYK